MVDRRRRLGARGFADGFEASRNGHKTAPTTGQGANPNVAALGAANLYSPGEGQNQEGGLRQMRIEELTQEQIERAKSLATNEERVAYLKECGVELEDDSLTEVAGGRAKKSRDKTHDCHKNPKGGSYHKWVKTGRKKPGRWIGIVDDVEYRCEYCGETTWKLW